MHVIIMRTYIKENITDSMLEAAKVDSAGYFRTYGQISIPLMKPVMAAVGFMLAIGYWNNWERGYLYIRSDSKQPLQTLLMMIEKDIQKLTSGNLEDISALATIQDRVPAMSARMAMLITVLGPVIIFYPFFQKYFVTGLTVGSVKG